MVMVVIAVTVMTIVAETVTTVVVVIDGDMFRIL